jgi:hypothetical protein
VAISLPSSSLSGGISAKASAEETATFCQSCASCQKCKDCAVCASGAHGGLCCCPCLGSDNHQPCCSSKSQIWQQHCSHGCSLTYCCLPARPPARLPACLCADVPAAPTICFLNRGRASCRQCAGCRSCPSSGTQPFTAYEGCAACSACAECCPSFYSACSGCSMCQYCKYCTMQCSRR